LAQTQVSVDQEGFSVPRSDGSGVDIKEGRIGKFGLQDERQKCDFKNATNEPTMLLKTMEAILESHDVAENKLLNRVIPRCS
jgi:hypothetical protein